MDKKTPFSASRPPTPAAWKQGLRCSFFSSRQSGIPSFHTMNTIPASTTCRPTTATMVAQKPLSSGDINRRLWKSSNFQEKYKPTGTLTRSPAKRRKTLKSRRQAAAFGLGLRSVAGCIARGGRLPPGGRRRPVGVRHLVSPSVRPRVEAQPELPAPELTHATTACFVF